MRRRSEARARDLGQKLRSGDRDRVPWPRPAPAGSIVLDRGRSGSKRRLSMKSLRLAVPVAISVAVLSIALQASAQEAAPPPQPVAPPPQPQPVPVVVVPHATAGQQQDGYVLELHVGTYLFPVSPGGFGFFGGGAAPGMEGGFFGGLKMDRLMIGLGFQMRSSDPGSTAMVWLPGLRYSLVRSGDERVELFGQFDLSVGHVFGAGMNSGNIDFGFDVGPGLRYWVHPQFAVGAVTLLNAQWNFFTDVPGDAHVVVLGVVGALALTGVF
jgi:hypothetical protein